jgi:polysaccharide pyruvyl transferase WcaK-like protein
VVGDATCDIGVAPEIIARVADRHLTLIRTALSPSHLHRAAVTAAPASARFVVAARYHNVIFALRLNKPTIAIAYAPKHEVLMTETNLSNFVQHAAALDAGLLIEQFNELVTCSDSLAREISQYNAVKADQVDEQSRRTTRLSPRLGVSQGCRRAGSSQL